MRLTEEQKAAILADFSQIFRQRYGEHWMFFLSSKLTPSPIPEIARQRNVSLSSVKQIRKEIRILGHYISLLCFFYNPTPIHSLDILHV